MIFFLLSVPALVTVPTLSFNIALLIHNHTVSLPLFLETHKPSPTFFHLLLGFPPDPNVEIRCLSTYYLLLLLCTFLVFRLHLGFLLARVCMRVSNSGWVCIGFALVSCRCAAASLDRCDVVMCMMELEWIQEMFVLVTMLVICACFVKTGSAILWSEALRSCFTENGRN